MFLLLDGSVWAQPTEMDYHECLDLYKVSVAPDGTIWNMPYNRQGSTFQRMTLDDTLWRNFDPVIQTDKGPARIESNGGLQYYKILFPNDTTILIVDPYLPYRDSIITYYRSTDKGTTWQSYQLELVHFSEPKSLFVRNGKIWMTLTGGFLYCSDDGGISFTNIPSPLVKKGAYCADDDIYMDRDGVHGSVKDEKWNIFITEDGWKTTRWVKTSALRDRFSESFRAHINRVRYWNNRLFAGVEGNVFVAELSDSIAWQPFPAKSFLVDTARNELVLIADEGLLLRTADLQHYDTIARLPKGRWYSILSVVGDRVYCRGENDIVVASDTGIREVGLYTENPIKIAKEERIRIGTRLYGKKQNILYCFDAERKQWYRVKTPLKTITCISAHGSEKDTVMLQDGYHAYLFCVSDASFTPYRQPNPLGEFLECPVDRIEIEAFETGCGGSMSQKLEYSRSDDKFVLENSQKSAYSYYMGGDSLENWAAGFNRTFTTTELDSLLRDLNEHYDQEISWWQFEITDADLDSMCLFLNREEFAITFLRRDNTAALRWVRDTILQLSDSLLTDIVMSPPEGWCTTNSKLTIRLTNSQGKVQILECYDEQCDTGTTPYMLPLKIMRKEHVVYSSHVQFMQFIATLMPNDMITREKFTTHELLCKIALQLLDL